jgi:hypothetical protein
MATWTIQGEVGKSWNDEIKSFKDRKIEDGRFIFQSLDVDEFVFSISSGQLVSEILPDYLQKVIIYRNGERIFIGHVTNRQTYIDSNQQSCSITISGPWWWMERLHFTTKYTNTGEADENERNIAVFGTAKTGQNLKTNIELCINRMVELGVPMASTIDLIPSTVAAMADFPRITISQMTCAQAITELVGYCPDAMSYFDYSSQNPTFNIVRRKAGVLGEASAITLNANDSLIESLQINPIIEMEVKSVKLPYTSAVSGKVLFLQQEYGVDSSPLPKKQIITISGPELDTYIPNFVQQTQTASFNNETTQNIYVSNPISAVTPLTADILSIVKASLSIAHPVKLWNGGSFSLYSARNGSNYIAPTPIKATYTRDSARLINDKGETLNGYSILVSGSLPSSINITTIAASVVGYIYYKHTYDTESPPYTPPGFPSAAHTTYPLPTWWGKIEWTETMVGYTDTTQFGDKVVYGFYKFNIPVTATNFVPVGGYNEPATNTTPANTPVSSNPDYFFLQPPAGLAQFLQEAQDFIPYEGTLQIVEDDVGATRYSGCKISILNSMAEYANMNAMVSSVSMDIQGGTTIINLGQPARLDYKTFVQRLRMSGQDNIVYTS